MQSADVARRCLDRFAEQGHAAQPGTGLLMSGPLASYLHSDIDTRDIHPDIHKAAGIQRCLRPDDMRNVGRTGDHGTFFQMATAVSADSAVTADLAGAAWTLTTDPVDAGGLGIAASRLRVVVPTDGVGAIWRAVGLDESQLIRRGPATAADVGGPAEATVLSNVVLDRSLAADAAAPDRPDIPPLKLWSLHRSQDGNVTAVGIGIERIAMATQCVATFSDTDQVRPILDRIALLTGRAYDDHEPGSVARIRLRVTADHVRTALMLADAGITPVDEGLGVVLLRVIRRTAHALRLLGLDEPALADLLPVARDLLAPAYPSVVEQYERIERVLVDAEAELRGSLPLRGSSGPPAEPETGAAVSSSELALLDGVRTRSGPTDSLAYQTLRASVRVVAILTDNYSVGEAAQDAIVDVVLDRTPFFAARSGQPTDRGTLSADDVRAEVLEARWVLPDLVVHRVRIDDGELRIGTELIAQVDGGRRLAMCQAHSGMHVLHSALREVLGDGAVRLGSLDSSGRLVVEIDASLPWSEDAARSVELIANQALQRDEPVSARMMDRAEALASGALESHGPDVTGTRTVRVVEIGEDSSREICYGTHVVRTSQVALIALTGSRLIAAGHRVIEAACGLEGFQRLTRDRDLVRDLSDTAGVTPELLLGEVERMVTATAADPHISGGEALPRVLPADAEAAAAAAIWLAGTSYAETRTSDSAQAKELAELVRDRLDATRPGVVVVTGGSGRRHAVVVSVNGSGISAGLSADELIRSGLRSHGGGAAGLAEGTVDSRHRQRATDRIRAKVGDLTGSYAE
jgi:alanyl-tRNA synthetase